MEILQDIALSFGTAVFAIATGMWLLKLTGFHIVKWDKTLSSNAKNWPFLIKMRGMHKSSEETKAIFMQEYYEMKLKSSPWGLLKTSFSEKARIEMEILGHEIEVQSMRRLKPDVDIEDAYRRKEALALSEYTDFKSNNMHPDQIELAMKLVSHEAAAFVDKYISRAMKLKKGKTYVGF